MKKSRTWIYHKTEEPKIVYQHQAQDYFDKGWADSPARFVKLKDVGIDETDPIQVQQFGESMEGVKNAVNDALNLDDMTKRELVNYAKEHFDTDLDKRDYKSTLIKTVRGLIGLSGK